MQPFVNKKWCGLDLLGRWRFGGHNRCEWGSGPHGPLCWMCDLG